jgi:hypothetical protein
MKSMKTTTYLRLGIAMLAGLGAAQAELAQAAPSLNMKLLVLSADGTEPSFDAMKNMLDHLAVPYQPVILRSQPLPALSTNGVGNYQGIVLATGALSYFDGSAWVSALTPANWTTLETYMRDYQVRLASFYTFPEARYGLRYTSALSTSDTSPGVMTMTTAGQPVFNYLRPAASLKVIFSYTYLAAAAPAAGETTTPILSMAGQTVGATHRKADGREYMALTMDHSQYLNHSLALHYGVVNWVTRGVFIGQRRIYVTPQNDDIFLSSSQFLNNNPACQPVGAANDPTYDPGSVCPNVRMTGSDLDSLADWQKRIRGSAQYRYLKIAHAYNGFGASADFGIANDPLVAEAKKEKATFNWLSHTYNHENLDCYLPVANSGICTPATYAQSLLEINQNKTIATQLGLSNDTLSMVTPGISGLNNPNFMKAYVDSGMRYVVTDTSRPGGLPAIPNTAIVNSLQPSVVMIPRRATNIFYNTSTPTQGAIGSETDEYNFLFGPNGIFRVGGPGGPPFFPTTQTYSQIIERESDAIVTYMLRGEMYPLMFHQANFLRYNGRNSLFTDLMDAVTRKWTAISKLQVGSLKQATLGSRLKERLDLTTAGINGTYHPGVGVTLTAARTAVVPTTGVCDSSKGCEAIYNGQRQDRIQVSAGRSTFLPYTSASPGADQLGEDK